VHATIGDDGSRSEPRVNMRAKVVELPFVARNREKAL
jgi:hypothetical protein